MKVRYILWCLFIALILSGLATSENLGTINVFVKDQGGEDIAKNSHLVGNLTVEVWHRGQKINSTAFPDNRDSIPFLVTNTGLYTVRAIATIEYNDTEYCYVGEYAPILGDRERCEDLCSGHSFQCDTGTDTCSSTRNNKGDGSDDKGNYICEVTEWFTTVSGSTYSFRFEKVYRYTQMNEVLTHVERNENDVAEVALFTDREKLVKLGKKLLHLDEVSEERDPQPIYDLRDIPLSMSQEVIEQVIDEAVDVANLRDQPILKHIFKGAYRSAIASEAASTIVVLGLGGMADPDSLKVNSRNWGYISVGVVASALAEKALGTYVLGGVAEGSTVALAGPVAIGVVVAIPVGIGLQFTMNQDHEAHLCEHALSDDLYAFIGEAVFGCTPESYVLDPGHGECDYVNNCFDYPLELVNLGEHLSRVSVGVDPDFLSFACRCHNVKSPEIDIATDGVYSEDVRFSFADDLVTQTFCSFPSDYDDKYSKLWMNIEVLPGISCDFDTHGFSDPPPLSQFKRTKPLITDVQHPSYTYRDATISATVRNSNPVQGITINYPNDPKGSEIIPCESEGGVRYSCEKGIWVSQYSGNSLEFELQAGDTINDNDQQLYRIEVVEDADSGGDACSRENCPVRIDNYFPGEVELTGHFISDYGINDGIDVYAFEVNGGDRIDITFSSEYPAYLHLKFKDSLYYPGESDFANTLESNLGVPVNAQDIVATGKKYAIIQIIKRPLPAIVIQPKMFSYTFGIGVFPGGSTGSDTTPPVIGAMMITSTDEGYYSGVYSDEDNEYGRGDVRLGLSTMDTESGISRIEYSVEGPCSIIETSAVGAESVKRFSTEGIPVVFGSKKIATSAIKQLGETCVMDATNWGGQVIWHTDGLEGSQRIDVDVYDGSGNYADETFWVTLDNTAPEVEIDESFLDDDLYGMVTLKADIDEYGSGLDDVSWYLDDTKIGSGKETVWGAYGLEGEYNLRAVARDKVGNEEEQTITVNLMSPDLVVEITSVPNTVDVRDTVTLTAEVSNEGDVKVDKTNITLYVDADAIDSEIVSISDGTVSFEWIAKFGEHRISVVADPDNDIIENDEENNIKSAELRAGPGLGENCGKIVNCNCDDGVFCDCSQCDQAANLGVESSIECNDLDDADNKHALYKVEVGSQPVAVYLTSYGSMDYDLYVAKDSCSGELVCDFEEETSSESCSLTGEGTHYYMEIRKIGGSSAPYELYVDVDADEDRMPDIVDNRIGERSPADTDDDGTISDFELLYYIELWVQGSVGVQDPVGDFDLLHAIDGWANPCSSGVSCKLVVKTYSCDPWEVTDSNQDCYIDDPERQDALDKNNRRELDDFCSLDINYVWMNQIRNPDCPTASANRNMPNSVDAGGSFTVTLDTDVVEGYEPRAITVVEDIPFGWNVISSTPATDAVYPSAVKWLFRDSDVIDRAITYTVEVPVGEDADDGRIRGHVKYTNQEGRDNSVLTSGSLIIEVDPAECTSGPCCDLNTHTYRNSYYICDQYHRLEYGCPWGTSQGVDAGVKFKSRRCSGSSSSCDGAISGWSGWELYDDCSEDEYCSDGECVEVIATTTTTTVPATTSTTTTTIISPSKTGRILELGELGSIGAEETVTLTAMLQNTGLGSMIDSCELWFWVSGKGVSNNWVGHIPCAGLAAGDSAWYSLNYEMPSGAGGGYTLWVRAYYKENGHYRALSDWKGPEGFAVIENVMATEVQNLVDPPDVTAGGKLTFSADVGNIGNVDMDSGCELWFWVGIPRAGGGYSWVKWPGFASCAGLGTGDTGTYSFEWTVPTDAKIAEYELWVRVYYKDDRGRYSTISDWTGSEKFRVRGNVIATEIPNLYKPSNTPVGHTVTFTADVENTGNVDMDSGCELWFWVSGHSYIGFTSCEDLRTGDSETYSFGWNVPTDAKVAEYELWAQTWYKDGGGIYSSISDWAGPEDFSVV